MWTYAALFVVFAVPLVVVYFASSEARERVYVRGRRIEPVSWSGFCADRYDTVVVSSGFVPTAIKRSVPVQGLLPVVRFVSKLVGRLPATRSSAA